MVSKSGRRTTESTPSLDSATPSEKNINKVDTQNSERQAKMEENLRTKSSDAEQVDESVTEVKSREVDSETVSDTKTVGRGDSQPLAPRDKVSCKFCSKDVIPANIQMHELHCSRLNHEPSVSGGALPKKKEVKITNKPSKNKNDILTKKTAAALAKVDADDFDGLISAVQNMDSKCHFKKCKQSTLMLSQTCMFCRQRFCYAHGMPEIHGCGDEAKLEARQVVIKEGILFRGNTVPSKKIDPDKRAHLQRKLDKKLSEMGSKRSGKKKSNTWEFAKKYIWAPIF